MLFEVSSFCGQSDTFWTTILQAACNKTLLGVVGNICCKDWINTSFVAVCTDHIDAVPARGYQRLEKEPHAVVECVIAGKLAAFSFIEYIEF